MFGKFCARTQLTLWSSAGATDADPEAEADAEAEAEAEAEADAEAEAASSPAEREAHGDGEGTRGGKRASMVLEGLRMGRQVSEAKRKRW